MSVAIFDETLSLLQFGLSKQSHPSNTILKNARSSVESYLETLQNPFIEPTDRSPPPPNLNPLREKELPTVSDEEFTAALANMEKQRRTLLDLVESDEREWPSQDDE